MGGIMSAPSAPAAVPAPAPVAETPVVDETQMRLDAIERNRRGRTSTIQTSERGLVNLNANAAQKKTLLGE